jgi:hypothetical protein
MKHKHRSSKVSYLLAWLAILGVSFCGLGCLVAASLLETGTWASLFDHIGAALLVVGALGAYEKWQMRSELLREIYEIFSLSESCANGGLQEIRLDPAEYDFSDMISKSRHLTMVFNDGHKWISNNFSLLDKRFSKDGTSTELFVVNPNGQFIGLLASKTGHDDAHVRQKITSAIERLRERFDKRPEGIRTTLKIYYIDHFPTYTTFLSEDRAVITLYTTSSQREPVPLFEVAPRLGRQTVFDFVRKDVENLRASVELVFDSCK